MKGMELPINMIVVVLIAVLVLTAVGVFLSQQFGGGASGIELENAFGQGCQQLRTLYNCDRQASFRIASYTPQGYAAGSGADFFGDICRLKGIPDHELCAVTCGCARTTV
jgi:hypothetical protein